MPAFEFEVEYAKSGRAGCKQCKNKIEQGSVRVGLKTVVPVGPEDDAAARSAAHAAETMKWHHLECFPRLRGANWFKKHLPQVEALTGLANLNADDQAKIPVIFSTCRGEGPALNGNAGSAVAAEATPSKKRKSPDGGADNTEETPQKLANLDPAAARGVLTEDQFKAIEDIKAELAKKSVALLGALLGKNGLPKSGRKEEILDRVSESKALGVPPKCPTCDNVKLKWSRSNGEFSCPGSFSEEKKRFMRCKGPAKDVELARTPWEEITFD